MEPSQRSAAKRLHSVSSSDNRSRAGEEGCRAGPITGLRRLAGQYSEAPAVHSTFFWKLTSAPAS
jgi:hypothetical protein